MISSWIGFATAAEKISEKGVLRRPRQGERRGIRPIQ